MSLSSSRLPRSRGHGSGCGLICTAAEPHSISLLPAQQLPSGLTENIFEGVRLCANTLIVQMCTWWHTRTRTRTRTRTHAHARAHVAPCSAWCASLSLISSAEGTDAPTACAASTMCCTQQPALGRFSAEQGANNARTCTTDAALPARPAASLRGHSPQCPSCGTQDSC